MQAFTEFFKSLGATRIAAMGGVAALVRTAIGFDAKRGDQVEVANLRLAETPANAISDSPGFFASQIGRAHV